VATEHLIPGAGFVNDPQGAKQHLVPGAGFVEATAAAAAVQTITTTGVASASAIGAAVLLGVASLLPSGVGTSSAIGTVTVSAQATVSPSGVASASAVGSPALSAVSTLSASGVASASALGSPTLTVGTTILADGVPSSSAIGSTTASPGSVTISATGVASSSGVGDPTVELYECDHPCWTEEEILQVTMNYTLETTPFGTVTVADALRIILSAVAGKLTGADGTTVSIRDMMDSKNRIVATVDSNGNRTAITTLDGST
jgi:hypothetical protein